MMCHMRSSGWALTHPGPLGWWLLRSLKIPESFFSRIGLPLILKHWTERVEALGRRVALSFQGTGRCCLWRRRCPFRRIPTISWLNFFTRPNRRTTRIPIISRKWPLPSLLLRPCAVSFLQRS